MKRKYKKKGAAAIEFAIIFPIFFIIFYAVVTYGLIFAAQQTLTLGGFKPEVQHLQPSKVRRCHHLVRPRPINNFSLKSASPLPV